MSPECESRLKKEFGERFDVVSTFLVVSVSLTYINKLTSTIIYQICQTFQLNMFVPLKPRLDRGMFKGITWKLIFYLIRENIVDYRDLIFHVNFPLHSISKFV